LKTEPRENPLGWFFLFSKLLLIFEEGFPFAKFSLAERIIKFGSF